MASVLKKKTFVLKFIIPNFTLYNLPLYYYSYVVSIVILIASIILVSERSGERIENLLSKDKVGFIQLFGHVWRSNFRNFMMMR